MKTVQILSCLLATIGTDAFAPNSQQSSSIRIKNAPSISTISTQSTSAASIRFPPLQSSTTDDESSRINTLSSLIPTRANVKTAAFRTQNQLREPSSASSAAVSDTDTDTSIAALPDWIEPIAWRSVIVVLCVVWASNFAVAKLVMAEPGVDSSLYALSRFGMAAASLAPFAIRSVMNGNKQDNDIPVMDLETLKQAIICGSWVAFGYLGQTFGLMTTTASKSCVICSMHCVFVAIIAEIWRVQKVQEENSSSLMTADEYSASNKFDIKQLLPAAVAVLGVAIVELKGAGGSPTIGDALSFAQPIGFGMGYLILEKLMKKNPDAALAVSAIKLTVVTVASFIMFEASPLLNGGTLDDVVFQLPDFSPILESSVATAGILYTGLITTALALWVESMAFAKVPATDASLILTTEPLFAAGCGAVALGETFGTSDYIGASLIVGACALSIFIDNPEAAGQQQQEGAVEQQS